MTIAAFSNHLPVRIRFGEGVADELAEVVRSEDASAVLVVIDAGLEEGSPGVAHALAALESGPATVVRQVKPPGEPTSAMADATAAALANAHADAVVAIGGGSVIDTAKAARLCAQLELPYARLTRDYPAPALPLIALPTTAGTGSEVSGGAVITDSQSGRKAGIAGANLRAQHALVDPLLTHSVPREMTAYTGIDALAQAIAGIVAKCATPIGDAIALESIRLIARSLPGAYADGADASARSEVACGSLMAGLAMNISDCTAEHSLGQAIGGEFDAPHGLTIGLVLAETLERERHVVPEALERVADALGARADGTSDGSRAVAFIGELLARLDFPVLSSLGVEERDLDRLTELAQADFFITQSPRPWTDAEVRAAFASALGRSERGRG